MNILGSFERAFMGSCCLQLLHPSDLIALPAIYVTMTEIGSEITDEDVNINRQKNPFKELDSSLTDLDVTQ